jgi:hypothetical protein
MRQGSDARRRRPPSGPRQEAGQPPGRLETSCSVDMSHVGGAGGRHAAAESGEGDSADKSYVGGAGGRYGIGASAGGRYGRGCPANRLGGGLGAGGRYRGGGRYSGGAEGYLLVGDGDG